MSGSGGCVRQIERDIVGDESAARALQRLKLRAAFAAVILRRIAIGHPDALPVSGDRSRFLAGEGCVRWDDEDFVGRAEFVRLGGQVEWLVVVCQPAGTSGTVRRERDCSTHRVDRFQRRRRARYSSSSLDILELRAARASARMCQSSSRRDRCGRATDVAPRQLEAPAAVVMRKRVSIRTGNSKNGDPSSRRLTLRCGVLNSAKLAVA